jgi:GrpB-like predicted nucleotidyltransferase (UPF0157 family)
MDARLVARLRAAGLEPAAITDPASAWRQLHEVERPRATLIERYAIEAFVRGDAPGDLDATTRATLAVEVLTVRDPGFRLVTTAGRASADPIDVVDYDPSWPRRFEAWRERLHAALDPVARRIEHVGSTAVPGLAAKPVIDIQVTVDDIEAEAGYTPAIEGLGVALRSRETGHRYFRPAGAAPRDVQIHVYEPGSAGERAHLLFRDYLRATSPAAAAYADAKRRAADAYREDRIAYNEAKSGLILDLLADAEAWARRTGWTA